MKLNLIFLFLFSWSSLAAGPSSVDVVTASYTVPAKKYARVVAHVISGGSFSINSEIALSSINTARTWTVLSNSVLDYWNSGTYGNKLQVTTADNNPNSGNAFSTGTAYSDMVTSASETYFLPAGTVISGTGTWRAVVEIYER